jgi:hypothetical protein
MWKFNMNYLSANNKGYTIEIIKKRILGTQELRNHSGEVID